jgi:hypothetical protein
MDRRIVAAIAPLCLYLVACGDSSSEGGDDGSSSGTTAAPTTTAPATDEGSTSADTLDDSTGATPTTTGMDSTGGTDGGVCSDEFPAIVTDIDETLTLSDEEFTMQLGDGNYDPLEREGGAAMINEYADLGYRVLYLTARAESLMTMVTNETAREATERWLEEHGYPLDDASTELILSESLVFGDAARQYKGEALMGLQAEGWRFDYAYGNAESDIGAYEDAGIDKSVTFIIGEQAGAMGTVAVAEEDWLAHTGAHLPTVPAVCQ